MLDLLRRKAQSPTLQATVIAIIIVFVFWGVGSNQGPGKNAVATVNGEAITYQEYQTALDRTVEQYREQLGGNLPADLLESLNIKQQVLNDMLQRTLLEQGGREMGIHVSKIEVQNQIKGMAAFQNNGFFDNSRYREVLKGSRLTPTKFENSIRQDILTSKVSARLKSFQQSVPEEFEDRFLYQNMERRIQYTSFAGADFSDKVEVNQDELATYFNDNNATYKTNPQLKLKYLAFLFADEMAAATVSPDDIAAYYERHKAEYELPEKRRARHILLKTAESNEEIRQQMTDILKRARDGEDFTALAKEVSEGPSAKDGGYLGFVKKGDMVKPFEDALFSLKQGEISEITQTSFGYHIIYLEMIQPARTKGVQEMSGVIRARLQRQAAMDNGFARASDTYEKIILAGSLAKFTEMSKTPVQETAFFSRKQPVQELAEEPGVVQAAFNLKKGELSSLIESPEGYWVLFVEDTMEPQVPELNTVKEEVEKDFIRDQAEKLAKEAARALLAEIQNGADLNATAREKGKQLTTSSWYSRNSNKDKNLPPDVITASFDLSISQPWPEETVNGGDRYYVFTFLEEQKPEEGKSAKAKKEFKTRFNREKEQELLTSWLDYMTKRSEIIVNKL